MKSEHFIEINHAGCHVCFKDQTGSKETQGRKLKSIGHILRTPHPKTLMVLLLFCKWSLIIPHEHTQRHTLTHLRTPPPTLCTAALGYTKTKWSASRHTDGLLLSPLINFKVKCEKQEKPHKQQKEQWPLLHSTSALFYPKAMSGMN